MQIGVVIDDWVALQKIKKREAAVLTRGTSEGAVRLRKMSAKYKETGLVQNMKKGFEEVTEASFWGGKVNGVAGTVRPLPERTLPVLSLTVDVIRCGYATKHLLATLAGFYISAFQFRRRFMSLLEEIFLAPSWMEDHCTFRIWPALEAELWCLVIATPMVRTNLRADYLNQISATDASDSFEAEVSTEVSAEFVEEVHRHSLRKSVWTRLLHPLSAQSREAGELPEDEELPGDERLEEHPLWGHVFRCLPFRTVWRKKIRRKRHINLHELRAVLISEERRALRHPHCKLLTGADSQVSLGALLKGRSSSSKLNGALRQSLPAYIGLDIHGGYLYVRSCDNPADDPTRSVPTRTPPSSMPRWLHDAVDGNFELLDDELVKCGMDPVSLLGLPPLENIVPVAEAPRPVPRAVRRRMWMRSLGGPAPSLTPGPDPEAFAASCLRGDAVTAEMVLSLLSLLPGEHAARGDSGARTKSWTTGVFVHGGAIGLRRHCLDFPLSTSMLTRYASFVVPTHQYSSLSLLQNLKTSVHKDAHNSWCHFNAVLPISSFSGGDIWSQVDGGPDKEEVRGHPYGGRNLKVSDGAVYLDPHKYHFTRAWRGLRVVMVLYTVRNIERIERNSLVIAWQLYAPWAFLSLRVTIRVPLWSRALPPLSPRLEKDYHQERGHRWRLGTWIGDVFYFECFAEYPSRVSLSEALTYPGYLDLYSGSRGVAHALSRLGDPWVLTFDWGHSVEENLLDYKLQRLILSLLERKAFVGVGGGPVCSSFSRAIRPAVRSKAHPAGLPSFRQSMESKVAEGNAHSAFVAEIVTVALRLDLPFWVENPRTSYMWDMPEWKSLIDAAPTDPFAVIDYCQLGAPWRKRTRFFVSGCLAGQRLLCQGGHLHQRLSGYSQLHRKSWTKVAEHYPPAVNRLLALHLMSPVLRPGMRRRLDLALCARCSGARIGEAGNPGPAGPVDRVRSLEEVELVTPATARLQARVLGDFEDWLARELTPPARRTLCSCAMAFCTLVRCYGNWLYQHGEPMYKFRHLMAWLQKNRFDLKGHLGMGWDLLTRWERLQPVVHRVPVPFSVFRALMSLALQKGWRRWSCVCGLAFYGVARAGEPLRGTRGDLLLPSDTLSELALGAFMAVRSPKTAFRGKGRLQHIAVKDSAFVSFLEKTLGEDDPQTPIYAGSAASFRRRWDVLLQDLDIDKSARLTPGGLRGGGAAFEYQRGLGLQELLCRMRIRHLATLESYLQEAAAVSVVPGLTPHGRSRVAAASALYPFALEVVTWGHRSRGGDSRPFTSQLYDVRQIVGASKAFAALRGDGEVVCWGRIEAELDANIHCRDVEDDLKDVQQLAASNRAFAAICGNGSLVTWGAAAFGGDSSKVRDQLCDVYSVHHTHGTRPAVKRPRPSAPDDWDVKGDDMEDRRVDRKDRDHDHCWISLVAATLTVESAPIDLEHDKELLKGRTYPA
ncbi:hypothetical protein AK812_SmicGene16820 [Symbiodinium microadriaticum]|uniref:Uncharacterized protein n=1 Tax=Symbiodinium microadriaticum TaxID=2951 RepID=A0A1Q9DZE7_SYMMI|nr:hypothetical protein AK812_SmicGene16820 [Symbiodinium microadriaticum]